MKIKGLPSTKSERPSDLERARGVGTNEPGNPSALPVRVLSPHGTPPRGLSAKEKAIFYHEGWGSIETRTGVLWEREFNRRLLAESTVESDRPEHMIDVTNDVNTDRTRHIWGLHGMKFNPNAQ